MIIERRGEERSDAGRFRLRKTEEEKEKSLLANKKH